MPSRDLPRPLLLGGLLGSALVAVGGLGAGSLPRPAPGAWWGVDLLARSAAGRAAGLVLFAAGSLVLVACWWRVRRVLDDVGARAVHRAALLWSLPLAVGPPVASRDVYAYAAQATIVVRGFDPYVLGPIEGGGAYSAHVDEVWRGTPSPYGPAFLAPAAALVRLTGARIELTVLGLRALAVLGVVLAGWALVRLTRSTGVPPARAAWLGVANPLVLLHFVSGAHNDALMIGLMLAAVAVGLGSSRAPVLLAAGALATVGALVKAPAGAALPVLVLAAVGWRGRARAAVLVGGGAALVAVLLPTATGLGWGWVETVDTGRRLLSLFSPTTGLATAAGWVAEAVGLVDDSAAVRNPVLEAAAAAAALAAAVLLLLTPWLGPVRALGTAMLALVVLSPTVLPWYALWAVVPLAAVVGRRSADALGAGCGVLVLATWPSGRSVVRPPLYGLPLAAAAAAAALARAHRPRAPGAPVTAAVRRRPR